MRIGTLSHLLNPYFLPFTGRFFCRRCSFFSSSRLLALIHRPSSLSGRDSHQALLSQPFTGLGVYNPDASKKFLAAPIMRL